MGEVKIDECVELVSVIAYLRGDILYNKKEKNVYMKEIDAYFHLYKGHPIIKKYKSIRLKQFVSLAILLEYKSGRFILRKEQNKHSLGIDNWNVVFDEILKAMADFYKISHFHKFFKMHEDFYAQICNYYVNAAKSLNIDWFKCFFGYEADHLFTIIPMALSQQDCYGLYRHLIHQNEEHIAVLCCPDLSVHLEDEHLFLTRVVHEYLRSFIAPLLYDNEDRQKKIQADAIKLFDLCNWTMEKQGYNDWVLLMQEYLVRAITNVYMQENKFTKHEIRCNIINNMARGFYLMPELVGYLNKYRFCRDKFKTFDEFYSEIVKFFSFYIDKEVKRVDEVVSAILEV